MTFRRGRRSDIDAVLALDACSFGDFWRLDTAGIEDARDATTHARFRVAVRADAVVGYAITGRQGRAGYLQRLAVDPSRRRDGIGAALVHDALRWLARWRARSVLVNTQETNTTALSLYESLRFRRKPEGLHVLRVPLPA